MSTLDDKINETFAGLVVRKDLVKEVRGNAIVPSYVLEFLLGQYCATNDEDAIRSGIETVKEILHRHYVHRNEAGLIRSNIREKGRWKVIDKVSVALNDKTDAYEASFANLGIKKVLVDSDTVKKNQKMLVSGVWSIADVEYEHKEEANAVPWVLGNLKAIQMSSFDFDAYLAARAEFTTEEWIDLLIQTIGFNPEAFGRRSKLLQLLRLIPFVERNYNLIELGPKGTGKSHIFSEFSPHGILISGGEVTVPKLFVSNSSGKIGLVGYWDTIAFDEFAGRQKKVDKALVDIMKNYLANKSFSRGVETLGAEASMAFIGNTKHSVAYMLKHTDLFEELPEKYYDSAFIDRLHTYLPGWEIDVIRGEMFATGYGFIVDYLAEVLRHLRGQDRSSDYRDLFTLNPTISTRDRDGVQKTFSGLMKLLFPGGGATPEEIRELLTLAMEGRKRVKDQLMRLDSTYPEVAFTFTDKAGREIRVQTLEEREHPLWYHRRNVEETGEQGRETIIEPDAERVPPAQTPFQTPAPTAAPSITPAAAKGPSPGHVTFMENQKGVSFDALFGPWLDGASEITLTDPYIRVYHQMRNLMELLEVIAIRKPDGEDVRFRLLTAPDPEDLARQTGYLEQIRDGIAPIGVEFGWAFDGTNSIHARHLVTDTGWKILLDRGLDLFQRADLNGGFSPANRHQRFRQVKAFEVTYLRDGDK
ncbi:BREX system Lon protease-like protein BrxL [Tabrizicola sp. BL-A-41-H6]|uniref:BREX system Lon protease-like protein BrxL n=1 Tax=Tabrizicola sp. BL-A-41-H6 TaxID=3421107 RepID=UPI003D664A3A